MFDGSHVKGIVKCREVPGEGKFILLDLEESRQQSWCQRCTQHYQRPVEHVALTNVGESCQCELDGAGEDPVVDIYATQDPQRISGLQVTKIVAAALFLNAARTWRLWRSD